jgi:hypothetical protein
MSRYIKELTESDAIFLYVGSKLQEISSSEVTAFDFVDIMKTHSDYDPKVLPMYMQVALNIEAEMVRAFEGFERMVKN